MDINRFKGPINIEKLDVNNLETPAYLNLSLPTKVKNVIVKANSDIKKINNIKIQSFMESVVKLNDVISFDHVTFGKSLIFPFNFK